MFEKIFGRTTSIKVIDVFLRKEERNKWMTLREVGRRSQINPGTISRNIHILVKNGILIEERPSKRIRIFKLNMRNKYVPTLIEWREKLLKIDCRPAPRRPRRTSH